MIKRFFEWFYFPDEKTSIRKIRSWRTFTVLRPGGSVQTVTPIWDWNMVRFQLWDRWPFNQRRIMKREEKEAEARRWRNMSTASHWMDQ